MQISKTMEAIVSRATIYERHIPHKEFFTDTSGKIEYILNSLWHRDVELESYSDYTLAVGCSHTFGIGSSTPWPTLIDNCYNAGIPGATVHDMCDVAIGIYKENPYKKLLLFAPHGERMLIEEDGKVQALMPYSDNSDRYKMVDIPTKMLYTNRSIEHLQYFCDVNDIELKIICSNSIQFIKQNKDKLVDKGADGVHYGDVTQQNFAGLFNAIN
jgi:hypothetical protein